ncbi:hypothetical protein NDU88_005485 [Pleurodeles waltl]|uniref:Uncharacterized protein n=1 Tax=Pleurodeles waltl TaxID=8319 RepID=A0AAV7PGZ4_PLEWA|nr:hypothetical protein NDU88_005485 [Pleurodeles waltl]
MYLTIPIPNGTIPTLSSEILTNFPNRNTEQKRNTSEPDSGKKQSKMESTPMRNGAEKGGVLRSRDQKDFFEEKQLVILRAQHQAADCAKHVYLQQHMPSNKYIFLVYFKNHRFKFYM